MNNKRTAKQTALDIDWVSDRGLRSAYSDKPIVELKYVWFPRRCHYTKKLLWFTNAYCVTRKDFLDEEMYVRDERRWYHKHAYLKLMLMS